MRFNSLFWTQSYTTNDFIRKVKKAWSFCRKQDVDEETFVDILRTKLPETFDELVNDFSDEDQKIVDKICEAISTLDKQKSEYLQDFATTRTKLQRVMLNSRIELNDTMHVEQETQILTPKKHWH